jgi:phosphoenolpyruvate carboxykinase (GTP)
MGDYFGHWLQMGKRLVNPPRIFHVNWFRTNEEGKFLWPGFGDNIRVLKWILERVDNRAPARATAIGNVPTADALDLAGLDLNVPRMDELLAVDPGAWLEELTRNGAFLQRFEDRLPSSLQAEHHALRDRLGRSAS